MRSTSKFAIILLISFLSIGFAAVATNLIINGQTKISSKSDDFDVFFTSVYTEMSSMAKIDANDNKHIIFSARTLSSVSDTTFLDYTVYNNSSQYNANVNVEFTATNVLDNVDYSDYYTVEFEGITPTSSGSTTLIPAKSSIGGRITITLNKVVLEDVQIEFSLTLTPSATERTEEGIYTPNYQIISGDLNTVGSVIKIADEEFYVIGNEDDKHVKLLSKYDLKLHDNRQTANFVINNTAYTTSFSNEDYWLPFENQIEYAYNDQSTLYYYVESYVNYLTGQGVNVTGRLISLEELSELGCDISNLDCSDSYSWVYSTNYWLGSVMNRDTGQYNLGVLSSHKIMTAFSRVVNIFGVRPVIIMEK